MGIIVFGASGSGTTTLGRELARLLDYKHLDVDDYFWQQTEIPFTVSRTPEERIFKLHTDIESSKAFVMSGNICGWSESFEPLLNLAVFVEFIDWAAQYDGGGLDMRSRKLHERWIETLNCPVIRVNGTQDYQETTVDLALTYERNFLKK